MVSFVCDSEHFSKLLTQAIKAKHTLWLGTADIKDVYISNGMT